MACSPWCLLCCLLLVLVLPGFQGYYDTTTSIQPLITLDEFRLHPLTHIQLESVFPLIRAMVRGGIVSVLVGYVKLLAHYLLAAYKDRPWRAVVKTLFWAYLTVLVGVLVAYFFEVFCWVILGAVSLQQKQHQLQPRLCSVIGLWGC